MTLYEVLGVSPDATAEEIRKAYRRLAREWHPDNNSSLDATRRMAEINAAYEALSDPEKREAYDAQLRQLSQSSAINAFDPFFQFGMMFRSARGMMAQFKLALGIACEHCRGYGICHPGWNSCSTCKCFYDVPVSVFAEVPCAQCGGSGEKPGDPLACPDCCGTGVSGYSERIVNGVRTREEFTCATCGGSKKRPQ